MKLLKLNDEVEIVESVAVLYDKFLKEEACKIIEKHKNVEIAGEYF